MKTIGMMITAVLLAVGAFANSVDILAKTLYHEARGEGEAGLRAVASVIHNRAMKRYGNVSGALCASEAKRKLQFSCWNGKRDLPKGKGNAWSLCVKIAAEMANGKFLPTHGHTHYYAYNKCNPKWASGIIGLIVGNHKFLTARG